MQGFYVGTGANQPSASEKKGEETDEVGSTQRIKKD